MMSAAAHAYLHTRIAVMATRLFTPATLPRLLALDIQELAERFQLTALLDAQLPVRVRSRAVEQALLHTLIADVTVLMRPMTADERALILSWARRFALFNLKTLIRGRLHERDPAIIRQHLYELPPLLRLSSQELFYAENVLELLRLLEQGPFSAIARQAREAYEQKRDPFAVEAAIDRQYYHELLRRALQFQGDNLQSLRQLLGALLDRVDLLWLLRFRFTYQLTAGEAFYHLVPSPRLLYRERLLQLVNYDNLPQLLEALPAPLNERMSEATDLGAVQRCATQHLMIEIRRVLQHSPSGVARALAYLTLRELDLAVLFTLIQGRLLGLPTELVATALEHAPAAPVAGGVAMAA